MKAVGYFENLPIDAPDALLDIDVPDPVPGPHDLLVRPRALSVNPVDIKNRRNKPPEPGKPAIPGWDASGDVIAIGNKVTGFNVGDAVWYSAQIDRPGTNAELHLVDARIASRKPATLDHVAAAAMPLTSVTAWECLFDRLGYTPAPSEANADRPLLLINGAGGLGSMVLQLGRLAGIAITTTAGRPETQRWCLAMGATEVLAHDSLKDVADNQFPRILCAHDTDRYFDEMSRLVAAQGLICAVAGTHRNHNLLPLMAKSAGFLWELVFTRSLFQTHDMNRQQQVLQTVAALVDEGKLKSPLTKTLHGLNAATMIEAHRHLESGRMIGKLVVAVNAVEP